MVPVPKIVTSDIHKALDALCFLAKHEVSDELGDALDGEAASALLSARDGLREVLQIEIPGGEATIFRLRSTINGDDIQALTALADIKDATELFTKLDDSISTYVEIIPIDLTEIPGWSDSSPDGDYTGVHDRIGAKVCVTCGKPTTREEDGVCIGRWMLHRTYVCV